MVSTRPTVEGRSVLDPFHPLGAVKRLEKKPLRCFTNDCFLKVGVRVRVRVRVGVGVGVRDRVGVRVRVIMHSAATPF